MTAPADPAPGHWTDQPERSNLHALRAMRWIAMTAGRSAARCVLHPVTLYYLLVNARARRESARYLGRALQRPARWIDIYRHLHHFAATVLDRVYFLQGRFDAFDVSTHGGDVIDPPLARGEGVMLVGAHLGSFEALRATAQGRGARVAMLMYEDNARLINATLAAVAPQAQLHTIALGRPGAMLSLRAWLDAGGVAGLLADRTLTTAGARGTAHRPRTVWFDFLGEPARFSDGPFRLAAALRRQVVFMAGLYQGGRRYELRFVQLADFRAAVDADPASVDERVHEALQRYVELLESLCRESPYNWFNFFDFWAPDATPPADASDHANH
ncbi:MAG: acyl-CoA synthetase [Burkholderiaceae bacterium]